MNIMEEDRLKNMTETTRDGLTIVIMIAKDHQSTNITDATEMVDGIMKMAYRRIGVLM